MNYDLEIKWNGKIIMQARTTGVLSYDILQMIPENFDSRAERNAKLIVPTLSDIMDMEIGATWPGIIDDGIGSRAEFMLIRLGDE